MTSERRPWLVPLIAWALSAITTTAWAGTGVGQEFPSFDAKDALKGTRFSLTDLRGHVVLVDFWATWCGPCVAEVPNIRRVYKKYRDSGFEIVSISLDKNRSRFKSYAKKNRMTWWHVMDGGGWQTRLAKKYGIRAIPAMYLLDHEGKVISTRARGRELERLVAEAVGRLPERPSRRVAEEPTKPRSRSGADDRVDRLHEDVLEARAHVAAVAGPLDELDTSLGDARQEIRILESHLTKSGAGESAKRRYLRLRENLARARCQLFACGASAQSVRLPEPVFAPDATPKRTDFLRAASQLPVATNAVIAMNKQLERVRREVTAMDEELEELERTLRRGASGNVTSRGAEVVRESEKLVTKCRTSWQRQIDTATKMVESLGATGKEDAARYDAIGRNIEACRKQLEDLAFGEADPRAVSETLDAICADVAALGRELEAASIRLPKNPMKRARGSDLRARVAAAGELDVARDALAQFRKLGQGRAAGGEAAAIRKELVALRSAAAEARGDERLAALERDFIVLAGRLLALHDRLGGNS
ncbi:MAG: TlpA family protein disulfide reductase [Planctomycetota bacterium]